MWRGLGGGMEEGVRGVRPLGVGVGGVAVAGGGVAAVAAEGGGVRGEGELDGHWHVPVALSKCAPL